MTSTPASVEPESSPEPGTAKPAAKRGPSKRTVIIVAGVVGVVVAVLVGVLIAGGGAQRDPITVVTVTVTAESPVPEAEPIPWVPSTALLEAVPGTVLGYAASAQAESPELLAVGAVEGWSLTYAAGDQSVDVQIGQWLTEEEAQAAFETSVEGADPADQGEVMVAGAAAGAWMLLVDGDTERTVWRNGTTVIVASGAPGQTTVFYRAFPL